MGNDYNIVDNDFMTLISVKLKEMEEDKKKIVEALGFREGLINNLANSIARDTERLAKEIGGTKVSHTITDRAKGFKTSVDVKGISKQNAILEKAQKDAKQRVVDEVTKHFRTNNVSKEVLSKLGISEGSEVGIVAKMLQEHIKVGKRKQQVTRYTFGGEMALSGRELDSLKRAGSNKGLDFSSDSYGRQVISVQKNALIQDDSGKFVSANPELGRRLAQATENYKNSDPVAIANRKAKEKIVNKKRLEQEHNARFMAKNAGTGEYLDNSEQAKAFRATQVGTPEYDEAFKKRYTKTAYDKELKKELDGEDEEKPKKAGGRGVLSKGLIALFVLNRLFQIGMRISKFIVQNMTANSKFLAKAFEQSINGLTPAEAAAYANMDELTGMKVSPMIADIAKYTNDVEGLEGYAKKVVKAISKNGLMQQSLSRLINGTVDGTIDIETASLDLIMATVQESVMGRTLTSNHANLPTALRQNFAALGIRSDDFVQEILRIINKQAGVENTTEQSLGTATMTKRIQALFNTKKWRNLSGKDFFVELYKLGGNSEALAFQAASNPVVDLAERDAKWGLDRNKALFSNAFRNLNIWNDAMLAASKAVRMLTKMFLYAAGLLGNKEAWQKYQVMVAEDAGSLKANKEYARQNAEKAKMLQEASKEYNMRSKEGTAVQNIVNKYADSLNASNTNGYGGLHPALHGSDDERIGTTRGTQLGEMIEALADLTSSSYQKLVAAEQIAQSGNNADIKKAKEARKSFEKTQTIVKEQILLLENRLATEKNLAVLAKGNNKSAIQQEKEFITGKNSIYNEYNRAVGKNMSIWDMYNESIPENMRDPTGSSKRTSSSKDVYTVAGENYNLVSAFEKVFTKETLKEASYKYFNNLKTQTDGITAENTRVQYGDRKINDEKQQLEVFVQFKDKETNTLIEEKKVIIPFKNIIGLPNVNSVSN